MPSYCAMIGCNSNGRIKQRKFFRFPMLNHSSANTLAISQARQFEWIKAIFRENFFSSNYKNVRVCDLHFVSGKSAHYTDIDNIDWVPTKNLGYEKLNEEPKNGQTEKSIDGLLEELHEESDGESTDTADECESNSNECLFKKQETQLDLLNISIGTQTDTTFTGMSTDIILKYQTKIQLLKEMLSSKNVEMDNFRAQEDQLNKTN